MLEERYNHAVAALDGVLYAAGGGASCSPKSNTLECYDPERNVWTRRAPMIRKRTNLYLTVCDWFLYAIGGSAFNYSKYALADCCNTIERYDPKTNEWTMVSWPRVGFALDGISILVLISADHQIFCHRSSAPQFRGRHPEWTQFVCDRRTDQPKTWPR